ncbi:4-hydroxy-3-methylbut-2-enyl diphosphate reductase [Vulcaniibacterium tengchongense]|uniref:4-hydroxy-3-methylbut-2-enyl diphosphate reductase n=2 Tax=Vulcaniibacterium tengchongense TaxID=1273429 RepID=A0A3N4V3E8_9GAMM|nr:4-hydroxy-3-methylbut-2-enyl diphosphate reductase [Vulcaniibacterium tengchongense]
MERFGGARAARGRMAPMDILLANPRGFCAGVDRAIEIVKRAIETLGAPIYVRHEVVHNRFVVEDLRQRGAIFVEELDEVPDGATVVFSAHGVSQAVRNEAARRGLKVFDATCPLVTKVHLEVARHCRAGRDVVLIGHEGHPEVEGTMGQWRREAGAGRIYLVEDCDDVAALEVGQPGNLAYTTQTTLSVDDTRGVIEALRAKYPAIQGPKNDDICYATQNRQDAVRELAASCDLVLVVGSVNSSNSNRLRELAEREGVEAHLIDGADEIDPAWVAGRRRIGVTAGASAPEVLVQGVIARLRELGAGAVTELAGKPEDMVFALPKELRLQLVD